MSSKLYLQLILFLLNTHICNITINYGILYFWEEYIILYIEE